MKHKGLDVDWIEYSGDCFLGLSRYTFSYDEDHRVVKGQHEIFGPNPVVDGIKALNQMTAHGMPISQLKAA